MNVHLFKQHNPVINLRENSVFCAVLHWLNEKIYLICGPELKYSFVKRFGKIFYAVRESALNAG